MISQQAFKVLSAHFVLKVMFRGFKWLDHVCRANERLSQVLNTYLLIYLRLSLLHHAPSQKFQNVIALTQCQVVSANENKVEHCEPVLVSSLVQLCQDA